MSEQKYCDTCRSSYTSGALHQRVHDAADELNRRIDHDVDREVERQLRDADR